MKPVTIGTANVGGDGLAFIAGPCALESLDMGLEVAWALKEATEGRPAIFKASLDKDAEIFLRSARCKATLKRIQANERRPLPTANGSYPVRWFVGAARSIRIVIRLQQFLPRQWVLET